MINAFELLDLPYSNQIIRVGHGYHSLQLYANTFWLDHLLDYTTIKGRLDSESPCPLAKQVVRLCRLHNNSTIEVERGPDSTDVSLLDKRLDMLASWGEEAHGLAQRVLWHRKNIRDRQAKGTIRVLINLGYHGTIPKRRCRRELHRIKLTPFRL